MSKLKWLMSRIHRTLWVRVSLYALLGILASGLASLSNIFLQGKAPIDISVEAIDSLLTVIASSMLAVTTFSMGALTSAYASATSNATARSTSLLTQDQTVQSSLATFIGSFVFSIVGLIALKLSAYGPEGRAVLFMATLLIILLIVIALLRWINQLTKLGRVSDTITRLERATKAAMETRLALPFLSGVALPVADTATLMGARVRADRVGYVQFIDIAKLSALCEKDNLQISVFVLPGTFVYQTTLLSIIQGETGAISEEAAADIRRAFVIGDARTFDQDPRFGLIALSEVALRALSPAVNDPGTAIDVISRQTRLLSFWCNSLEAGKDIVPEFPRVHVPALVEDDLFEDAFNLIGRDGATQIDIVLRLAKSLWQLSQNGPEAGRQAANRQLDVVVSRARESLHFSDDAQRLATVAAGFGTTTIE